jgi:hypothetical protein
MRSLPPLTQFAPADLETLHVCPYCGGTRLDYLFVERGYPYVECHACGLVLLATRLRESLLSTLGRAEIVPWRRTKDAARQRVALLGALPARAKVVDDSCGSFADDCRASGFEVTLSAQGLADLRLASASVDAVASFERLNQLYRPWDYFREVARVLRPSGVLLTRLRDMQSWKKQLGRGSWNAPSHVFHYPSVLVERMAREAGLRLDWRKPAFDAKFPSLFAEAYYLRLLKQP